MIQDLTGFDVTVLIAVFERGGTSQTKYYTPDKMNDVNPRKNKMCTERSSEKVWENYLNTDEDLDENRSE